MFVCNKCELKVAVSDKWNNYWVYLKQLFKIHYLHAQVFILFLVNVIQLRENASASRILGRWAVIDWKVHLSRIGKYYLHYYLPHQR